MKSKLARVLLLTVITILLNPIQVNTYTANIPKANKPIAWSVSKQLEDFNYKEETLEPILQPYPTPLYYNANFTDNDKYLLAKIAKAEAGTCNIQTKTLVIMCVLNRVYSDKFPNTIHDVIFQQNPNGSYQFSPIGDGRWYTSNPDNDCYEALDIVLNNQYDYSDNCLYFETCVNKSWHSTHLTFLYESNNMRFYK